MDTSRFDNFTVAQYNALYDMLVAGDVVVPASYPELVTFLEGLTNTDTTNIPAADTVGTFN